MCVCVCKTRLNVISLAIYKIVCMQQVYVARFFIINFKLDSRSKKSYFINFKVQYVFVYMSVFLPFHFLFYYTLALYILMILCIVLQLHFKYIYRVLNYRAAHNVCRINKQKTSFNSIYPYYEYVCLVCVHKMKISTYIPIPAE